jgi:tetratricopeptide (TPR) repeat protein
MNFHSFCPRCGTEFAPEQFATGSVICSCGWFDDTVQTHASHKTENSTIKAMAAFGFIFVAGFLHIGSWGNYALSIPFTKAAQVTGLLSADGYRGLAKTCITLNKWTCAETALVELATDRGDVEGYAQAGSLYSKLNNPQKAISFYAAYEKAGGKNAMSLLSYAKALEAAGQDNEATRVYEKSIAANPLALPVQATSGIVHIQLKHGQYVEAYERILSFHESAENANGYLNVESGQLQKQLGEKTIAQIEKKHTSRAVAAK